ncbi:B12-binding domain-containing radical SAM protein [Candidatus Nitronereus thalassa]|uniref:Radical SAM protein n=1 Tax=Candidatus Nitronereus thalassa TaxID=3020898 RepID=A0ABU3K4E9_9BACT|nr:radical SAM protein [Candidatus Nitronereus thalassa]MDT7041266.1 radical SAM protein [Candidatus Nitronereus thalassa]
MRSPKTFRIELIKPSRYDEDGYVVQWVRSLIPSNSLAVLYGLAMDCTKRKVLGDDVEIMVDAHDETNTVLPIRQMIRNIQQADGGFVGLVGVQTNHFPRSLEIARPFLDAGIPVIQGGFHVSGCLSMLPEIPADLQVAMDMGITLYAGEAEGRLDSLLRDVWEDRLQPLYNYLDDLPELSNAVVPFLPKGKFTRSLVSMGSFDAGRGCPFQCSFCTIINVQGQKSRWRTADDIEACVRANIQEGARGFFITDDDFARNKNWEPIFDRLIKLREEEGLKVKFIIQVDTLCHRLPNFIEKAARAGCKSVFIGLENIDPENLKSAKKGQNKIWEYRQMLQAWKDNGVITYAGYILGFPGDTPESVARNIEIIKRELPVDLLEFFCLTPLPGSEDHKNLSAQGVWMDPDMNKYTLEHVTMEHPLMSRDEWYQVYRDAWDQYYTPDHVETMMRRVDAKRISAGFLRTLIVLFYGCITINKLHPLEGGYFRRKVRTQRRPVFSLENPVLFYCRRLWEIGFEHIALLKMFWTLGKIRKRVKLSPDRRTYTDLSLTPVTLEEEENLDLIKVFHPRPSKVHQVPTQPTSVS